MNQEHLNPIPPERISGLQAMGIFMEASYNNPSSPTGQASRIAMRCRVRGLDPLTLGKNLLTYQDLISQIRERGDLAHIKNGVHSIKQASLTEIIKSDFDYAHELMSLDGSQLAELCTPSREKPTSPEEERELIKKAQRFKELNGVFRDYMKDQ